MNFIYTQSTPTDMLVMPSWITCGDEGNVIEQSRIASIDHLYSAMSYSDTDLYIKFTRLKEKWEDDTKYLSNITDICNHPAYQEIISLGKDVVPYIIIDLSETGHYWFWALQKITHEDPIPEEHYGYINKMTQDWIQWWWYSQYELL